VHFNNKNLIFYFLFFGGTIQIPNTCQLKRTEVNFDPKSINHGVHNNTNKSKQGLHSIVMATFFYVPLHMAKWHKMKTIVKGDLGNVMSTKRIPLKLSTLTDTSAEFIEKKTKTKTKKKNKTFIEKQP